MAWGLPGKKGFDATECASPFGSLGLRARIVDFGPEELQSFFLSVPSTSLPSPLMTTNARGKRKASQVYGPMDRYLVGRNCDVSQLESVVNDKSRSSTNNKAGGSDYSVANKFPWKNEGHRALLDGMWNYFSKKSLTKSAWNRHVFISNRAQVILAMHLTICYIVLCNSWIDLSCCCINE